MAIARGLAVDLRGKKENRCSGQCTERPFFQRFQKERFYLLPGGTVDSRVGNFGFPLNEVFRSALRVNRNSRPFKAFS